MSTFRLDWQRIGEELDTHGCAVIAGLLSHDACAALTASYADDALFRSRIVMSRHGFGRGEYKYLAYPAARARGRVAHGPATRHSPPSPIAGTTRWAATPATRASTLASSSVAMRPGRRGRRRCCCSTAKATSTACTRTSTASSCSRYRSPVLLSAPGRDFTGGEFVLTEQRPRLQSRAEVVPLAQGDAVIFPVHHRPVRGTRGTYRVNLRHGVSRVRSGHRHTLGIIFHDAR